MRNLVRKLAAAAMAALVVSGAARDVRADPLGVEIAALGGLVLGSPPAFGVGLRAGASIESFYFGARVVQHWVPSHTISFPDGGTATESSQSLFYGIALGYDLEPASWLILRPEVGVGLLTVSGTCTGAAGGLTGASATGGGCAVENQTVPYVELAVSALFALGRVFFVGADVDGMLAAGGLGFATYAQAGIRF